VAGNRQVAAAAARLQPDLTAACFHRGSKTSYPSPAIAAAARELVQKRDAWLNPAGASEAELKKRTLTNLYNRRPTWLDLVHRKLDEAVFAAYGWPVELGDEKILGRLLQLNLPRAAAGPPNQTAALTDQ
jgi:hypothetical protein